jgi:hypothetical protein
MQVLDFHQQDPENTRGIYGSSQVGRIDLYFPGSEIRLHCTQEECRDDTWMLLKEMQG